MDRIPMAVGAILMAILLATAPVAATAPLAFEDHPSSGAGSAVPSIGSGSDSQPVGSSLNEVNDSSTGSEDTTTGDSTTTDGSWGMTANTIIPCCGGGSAPADKEPWQFDANYDREINWSEKEEAEQEYDAGTLTEESYDNVTDAYWNEAVVMYPDPDDDGMTIREEELWTESGVEMAKYATNIDDDGFSDFTDKRPQMEDEPPEVNLSFSDSGSELTVSATDNEGLSRVSLREPGTDSFTDLALSGTADEQTFTLNSNTEYWVNVSDINNNKYAILFETGSDGSVEVKKAGFAVMAIGFASPVPGDSVVTTPAAVTMVLFAAAIATVLTLGTSGEIENVPYTGSETGYENADASVTQYFSDGELPVRLPSGFGEEIPDPAGGSLYRGHGWEYIQLVLPGITQGEIGDILRTPNKVEELDDGALVIGDNPNGPGEVAIRISEGVVVSVSHTIPDNHRGIQIGLPESTIEKILNKGDWDHNQIGSNRGEVIENVRKIVNKPDEIWKDPNQDRWMYVKRIVLNGVERIAIAFVTEGKVRTAFVPTHPDYSPGYTDEIAKWYIKDQIMEKWKEVDEIIQGVNEGEKASDPGNPPDLYQ